jgi:HK97 family phage portal protein
MGGKTRRGIPSIARPAETIHTVQCALKARVGAISKVPLRISDGGDRIIEGGDLHRLINHPNQWMDRNQYMATIEAYLSLYDECIVAKIGEPGSNPDELIPLNPKKLQQIPGVYAPTGMQVVAGWWYTDAGGGMMLTWDDVIPIIGTNPHAPFKGLSSILAAERSISHDVATREQNLALFSNGCMPDIILTTDKNIDKDQRNEILDQWNARMSGTTNAHKTGIVWGGLKAEKHAFNPSEMQALEGLRFDRQDILMAMRVYPAMVMLMEGETGLSQGSSTSEQMVAWWSNEGLSELDRIATAHQRYLVDAYVWKAGTRQQAIVSRAPSLLERQARRNSAKRRAAAKATSTYFLWFDENDIEELVEHRRMRIDQMGRLLDRGWLPDDINDYLDLGLPPHPTNIGTLPYSLQAVTDLGSAAAEAEPQVDADERGSVDGIFSRIGTILSNVRTSRADAADFEGVWKLWLGFRKQWEKASASKHSRLFLDQRKRVLARLDAAIATALDADNLLASVFPLDAENQAVTALLKPLIINLFEAANEVVNAEFGIANPFEIDDPNIQTAVERRIIQGSKINESTTAKLRAIMARHFDEGWTQQQLTDEIANYYGQHIGASKARPATAARTQVAGIVNDSRMITARNVGGLRKGWLQGASEEPRADHTAAQAQYLAEPIALDEKFVVGGEPMDAPGDATAAIGQVANCTCMVVFLKDEA